VKVSSNVHRGRDSHIAFCDPVVSEPLEANYFSVMNFCFHVEKRGEFRVEEENVFEDDYK
jgi:hypothetical protein